MFRLLDGLWRRFDAVIHERCHEAEEVNEALHNAGFREIRRQEAHELGMGGQLGEGRAFWVAS